MNQYDYDLFTIGAGSGGVRASRLAASFGARTAVAEPGPLGGTCVNAGCIPKKLLTYAAQFGQEEQEFSGYGWSGERRSFDWRTLVTNKNAEISRLNGVYERLLLEAGVTIVRGRASIVDPHTIQVGDNHYTARHILVASGGYPSIPEIPGAHLGIASDDAFHLNDLPPSVVVVGGGYIAVEFASIFDGLGSRTTLVHRGAGLLKGFDADLGIFLAQEMGKQGVRIRLNQSPIQVEKHELGLRLTLSDGSIESADMVLFATGRVPNTRGLGLEGVDVRLKASGGIAVDEHYRTNVDSIYAIGDCIGQVQLTSVALAEGTVVAKNLFNRGAHVLDYTAIPSAVFSHPNVAAVGLSEAQASAKGYATKIFRSVFTPLRQTLTTSPKKVMLKLVVDERSDRVLGAHMVGPDAGEIIQGIAIALRCGATKAQFDSTLGIHPTVAEEFVTMRMASA